MEGLSEEVNYVATVPYAVFPLDRLEAYIRSQIVSDPLYFIAQADPSTKQRGSPIIRLDHIGIVTKYEKKIRKLLELLGARIAYEGVVGKIGVSCEYHAPANVDIEIVSPVRDNSIVSAHRTKMPFMPLHHLAFEVRNLEDGIEYFRERGYHLVDGSILLAPKPFHRVVFLLPVQTGGMLIELVADDGKEYSGYGGKQENVWQV